MQICFALRLVQFCLLERPRKLSNLIRMPCLSVCVQDNKSHLRATSVRWHGVRGAEGSQ